MESQYPFLTQKFWINIYHCHFFHPTHPWSCDNHISPWNSLCISFLYGFIPPEAEIKYLHLSLCLSPIDVWMRTNTGFERFLSASRKLSSHKTRTPWRTRTKRISIKLTPAQKALKKAQRLEAKETYHDALLNAQTEVQQLADGLRERFGKHSSQYYLEEIVQISRLQKKRKVTGAWNAYVSMEVKRINSGTSIYYIFTTKSLTIFIRACTGHA